MPKKRITESVFDQSRAIDVGITVANATPSVSRNPSTVREVLEWLKPEEVVRRGRSDARLRHEAGVLSPTKDKQRERNQNE